MPRVLICCGPQAVQRLEQGLRHLGQPADDYGPDRAVRHHDLAVYIGETPSPTDDSGISVAFGVVLALEGYLTHRSERGAELRAALIEDFLAYGERCVQHWRGSFRLLIAHRGVTRIYADHTAGRAMFFADDPFGPIYSSHAAPLLAAVNPATVDGANLLHFMRNGRFFAGASLFREVRQLEPGRGHRIRAAGRSEFAWYRYRLQPRPVAVPEVLPELKRRLDVAVLRHWRRAEAPALLLSGGYDSRYILNTLAENVARQSLCDLFTCLWGEPSSDPDSDAAWAAREAQRHGLTFEFFPLQADVPALFESTFAAQSGMTAHVITHTDDLARCCYLSQRGYRSLLRGDECFGPNGTPVRDVSEALARIGLNGVPPELPWLASGAPTADWRAAHEQWLRRLGQVADDPNDVRDQLYFAERLPSVHTHLNAHRSPYLENHSPLLDADVLDLVRQLPRELRTDKRIFKLCFREYFPTTGFAGSGNAFDLRRLWQQEALAHFIAARLEQLPAPFAERYFAALAASIRLAASGAGPPPSAEELQLASRAIVLGQWLRQDFGGYA